MASPKAAKNINRLMGFLNFGEKMNVVKMKVKPRIEKTEVTLSVIVRIVACLSSRPMDRGTLMLSLRSPTRGGLGQNSGALGRIELFIQGSLTSVVHMVRKNDQGTSDRQGVNVLKSSVYRTSKTETANARQRNMETWRYARSR
jgi:hypothetical protein